MKQRIIKNKTVYAKSITFKWKKEHILINNLDLTHFTQMKGEKLCDIFIYFDSERKNRFHCCDAFNEFIYELKS